MSACNTRNVYCRIIKIITFNDPSLSLWLKILIFNIQTLQKWQDYLGQVVLSLAITEQVDQHQNTVNCWNSGTLQSCKANDLHFISYEWCRRFSPHWPALWSECPVLPLDAQGRQGGRCTWPIENVFISACLKTFLDSFATWMCLGPSGRTLPTSPWRLCSNPSPPV